MTKSWKAWTSPLQIGKTCCLQGSVYINTWIKSSRKSIFHYSNVFCWVHQQIIQTSSKLGVSQRDIQFLMFGEFKMMDKPLQKEQPKHGKL